MSETRATCRVCREDLPLDKFEWRNDSQKYRTECRACRHLATAAARYGISVEFYKELLARQDSCCAICKVHVEDVGHATFRRLVVDHDHRTGQVRGLLCSTCNAGLGHFHDSINKLQNAIEYLRS